MNNLLLGYDIDPATVNWLIVGAASIVTTVFGGIYAGGRRFATFIKPYIVDFFTSHKALVDTMSEQVPVVSATLAKLGETQQQQVATLEKHSQILELHGGKLDKLLSGRNHEVKQ